MPSPYETLGVKSDATEAQIKSAYLKLAKKHHPDLNPGDKRAEERFKAVNAAHDLLADTEKRARFDRGEIDASGQTQGPDPRQFYKQYANGDGGARYRTGSDPSGFQDIFADLFANARGGGFSAGGQPQQTRGQDQRYQLAVTFAEAALGATRRLTLPDGLALEVTIPPGLEDGQTLRLRGKGGAGWNGGPAGDALIEVTVQPHAHFTRVGADLHLDLPVTAGEAALGARVAVPTLTGQVQMTVPRHSESGRQLRLRGRGIPATRSAPAGDLYVTLRIVLGTPDEALEEALRAFYERHPMDPRAGMDAP